MKTIGYPKAVGDFAITILVHIEDRNTRSWLGSLLKNRKFKEVPVLGVSVKTQEILESKSIEESLKVFEKFFGNSPGHNHGLILISDRLVQENIGQRRQISEKYCPQKWIEEIRDRFSDKLLAAIAITPHVDQRIADIDQLINPDASESSLTDILQRAIGSLIYKTPPPPIQEPMKTQIKDSIELRVLNSQSDLRDYFRLRHKVYSIIGYLPLSLEFCDSQLEIDSCDQYSIHVGAYLNGKLVGTARLIASEYLDRSISRLVKDLASEDLEVEENMNKGLQLGLPVVESNPINGRIAELNLKNQKYGELSRVIIHWEYRGAGISNLLVDFLISQAKEYELSTVFLECLEIHQRFYEKHGFVRVPGMHLRRVVHIDKKVIAMERNFN